MRWIKQYRHGLFGACFLIFFILSGFYGYQILMAEMNKTENNERLQSLSAEVAALQTASEAAEAMEIASEELLDLLQSLPPRRHLQHFLIDLDRVAAETGVYLGNISVSVAEVTSSFPEHFIPFLGQADQDLRQLSITPITISFQLEGSYAQYISFLRGLDAGKRTLHFPKLQFGISDDEEQLVIGQSEVTIYYIDTFLPILTEHMSSMLEEMNRGYPF
jgi:Tfp pilus assembly protein PilO